MAIPDEVNSPGRGLSRHAEPLYRWRRSHGEGRPQRSSQPARAGPRSRRSRPERPLSAATDGGRAPPAGGRNFGRCQRGASTSSRSLHPGCPGRSGDVPLSRSSPTGRGGGTPTLRPRGGGGRGNLPGERRRGSAKAPERRGRPAGPAARTPRRGHSRRWGGAAERGAGRGSRLEASPPTELPPAAKDRGHGDPPRAERLPSQAAVGPSEGEVGGIPPVAGGAIPDASPALTPLWQPRCRRPARPGPPAAGRALPARRLRGARRPGAVLRRSVPPCVGRAAFPGLLRGRTGPCPRSRCAQRAGAWLWRRGKALLTQSRKDFPEVVPHPQKQFNTAAPGRGFLSPAGPRPPSAWDAGVQRGDKMGDGASCPKGPWAGRADSSPCLRSVCRVPRRLPSTWGAVPPSWRCPEPLIQARLGASPLRPVGFSCGQRRLVCLCHPGDRARQPGVCSMVGTHKGRGDTAGQLRCTQGSSTPAGSLLSELHGSYVV